jgi:hypothetical protein
MNTGHGIANRTPHYCQPPTAQHYMEHILGQSRRGRLPEHHYLQTGSQNEFGNLVRGRKMARAASRRQDHLFLVRNSAYGFSRLRDLKDLRSLLSSFTPSTTRSFAVHLDPQSSQTQLVRSSKHLIIWNCQQTYHPYF